MPYASTAREHPAYCEVHEGLNSFPIIVRTLEMCLAYGGIAIRERSVAGLVVGM